MARDAARGRRRRFRRRLGAVLVVVLVATAVRAGARRKGDASNGDDDETDGTMHDDSGRIIGGRPTTTATRRGDDGRRPRDRSWMWSRSRLRGWSGEAGRGGRYWATTRADASRRDAVRDAFRECLTAYVTYASGHDELAPASRRGVDDFGGVDTTLADALDTMFIMGMKKEFAEGLGRLKAETSGFRALINGEVDRDVSVFETNIRVLGGLLAAHDLSGDGDALELAESFAARLSAAFDTPSGVPKSFVNVKTGKSFTLQWTGGKSILADFGSMHLEWATLSARTKNPVYEAHTGHVFEQIARARRNSGAPVGLFPHLYDTDAGKFAGGTVTFGALGDSFYEYLIKCWRSLADLKDASLWREMFDDAVAAMTASNMTREWKREGDDVYLALSPIGSTYTMEHLACFAPGMLVLGGAEAPTKALAEEYVELARKIARTCVAMYDSQPSGLAPDHVKLVPSPSSPSMNVIDGKNIQRPETVESLFYLYRKTGEEQFRDQAWKIFQSMKAAYSVPGSGWQGVRDVRQSPAQGDDKMQSFFLAETLKYLYLIFSDSDEMHLDEWVFNTEAHPFRITKTRAKSDG